MSNRSNESCRWARSIDTESRDAARQIDPNFYAASSSSLEKKSSGIEVLIYLSAWKRFSLIYGLFARCPHEPRSEQVSIDPSEPNLSRKLLLEPPPSSREQIFGQ